MNDMALHSEIRGLALCAGAGSIEIGIRACLGQQYRCVGYCERDAYAASVLVARMEDQDLDPAPIWDDVATFNGHAFCGRVDLVSAGFPCQPWSSAGKRGGTEDARWIWPDIARVIREARPSVVFLENVPGLVLGGLEHVLGDLALCGFDAEWDCFSAEEIGAPHKRERVFILAWDVSDTSGRILRLAAKRNLRGQAERGYPEPRDLGEQMGDANRRGLPRNRLDKSQEPENGRAELADPDRTRREGSLLDPHQKRSRSARQRGEVAESDLERREGQPPPRLHARRPPRDDPPRSSARPCWAWPPGPDDTVGWSAFIDSGGPEPAICRSADGLAGQLVYRKDRLRILGNGTVPPQVEKAFQELAIRAIADR